MTSNRSAPRPQAGFTLLELMVTVVVIGLLASVALPAMRKSILRAKHAEALMQVSLISKSARAYFLAEHASPTGKIVERQFPDGNEPPTQNCAEAFSLNAFKCPGGVNGNRLFKGDATWDALSTDVGDPHYFTYRWEVSAEALMPVLRWPRREPPTLLEDLWDVVGPRAAYAAMAGPPPPVSSWTWGTGSGVGAQMGRIVGEAMPGGDGTTYVAFAITASREGASQLDVRVGPALQTSDPADLGSNPGGGDPPEDPPEDPPPEDPPMEDPPMEAPPEE